MKQQCQKPKASSYEKNQGYRVLWQEEGEHSHTIEWLKMKDRQSNEVRVKDCLAWKREDEDDLVTRREGRNEGEKSERF